MMWTCILLPILVVFEMSCKPSLLTLIGMRVLVVVGISFAFVKIVGFVSLGLLLSKEVGLLGKV